MPPSRRSGHATKSAEEKRDYRENVIRPQPTPTMDLLPASDSTAAVSAESPSTLSETRPTPARGETRGWIREHLSDIGYATAIVAFMAWIGNYVVNLNREVGELKQQVLAIDKAIEKATTESTAAQSESEQRTRRQIERLEDRLERREGGAPVPQRDRRQPPREK